MLYIRYLHFYKSPFPSLTHQLTYSLTNFILRISCHRDQKTLNQSSSFLYASSILALPNFLCVNTLLVFLKLLSLMTIFICVVVIVMHSETIFHMVSIQRGCYFNVSYCCCCYWWYSVFLLMLFLHIGVILILKLSLLWMIFNAVIVILMHFETIVVFDDIHCCCWCFVSYYDESWNYCCLGFYSRLMLLLLFWCIKLLLLLKILNAVVDVLMNPKKYFLSYILNAVFDYFVILMHLKTILFIEFLQFLGILKLLFLLKIFNAVVDFVDELMNHETLVFFYEIQCFLWCMSNLLLLIIFNNALDIVAILMHLKLLLLLMILSAVVDGADGIDIVMHYENMQCCCCCCCRWMTIGWPCKKCRVI